MASPWDAVWNAINAIWGWINSLWSWVKFDTKKIKDLEDEVQILKLAVVDLRGRVEALERGGHVPQGPRATIQLGPFRKK